MIAWWYYGFRLNYFQYYLLLKEFCIFDTDNIAISHKFSNVSHTCKDYKIKKRTYVLILSIFNFRIPKWELPKIFRKANVNSSGIIHIVFERNHKVSFCIYTYYKKQYDICKIAADGGEYACFWLPTAAFTKKHMWIC